MIYGNSSGQALRGTLLEKPILLSAFVTASISMIFSAFPQIDLSVSRLFYVEGQGFPASNITVLQTFRAIGQYFPLTLSIVMLVGLALKLIYPTRPCLFNPRFTVYFASLFLLGPGLIVNLILKPFWDRPRPRQILEFGGDKVFMTPWQFGGETFDARSFVSGEVAVVVCLIPLAFFVPPVWRRCVFVLLSLFAAATGLNRMVFGAHFLSDVLIAAGLMAMLASGLWYLIYVRPGAESCDDKLDALLSQIGFALHEKRRNAIRKVRAGIALVFARLARLRWSFNAS